MNIGIYFGSVIDGFRGALLAAIFIYLPCFLSLLGLLPEWKSYRDRQGIRRLYEGLTCSTTGLTLAIVKRWLFRSCWLWKTVCKRIVQQAYAFSLWACAWVLWIAIILLRSYPWEVFWPTCDIYRSAVIEAESTALFPLTSDPPSKSYHIDLHHPLLF